MKARIELAACVGRRRLVLSEMMIEVRDTLLNQPELTVREIQVRDLMLAGKVHKEIATALNLSVSSVKQHAGNLYKKYGIRSRTELIYKLARPEI